MKLLGLSVFVQLLLVSCMMRYTPPVLDQAFDASPVPASPDYSYTKSWAALPETMDAADLIPQNTALQENQENAKADVFFIHPTTYTYDPKSEYKWNGSLDDEELNKITDNGTIKNQASIFNAAGRVFAPRYRQAHIHAFFAKEKEDGNRALEMAYQDVKNAFQYYLQNYNQGRPFILAAHSQGTIHAGRLIKDFIEEKDLENQLIAAYLIGMPVPKNYFNSLKVCGNPDDTDCFVSWNTFADGYYPKTYNAMDYENSVCVNPITWTTNDAEASRNLNKGGVVWNYKVIPAINSARVKDGMLWICKPYIPGRMFYKVKNYHIGDYNLFYENIRENAVQRVEQYFEIKESKAN
jgi:hypothetical protein